MSLEPDMISQHDKGLVPVRSNDVTAPLLACYIAVTNSHSKLSDGGAARTAVRVRLACPDGGSNRRKSKWRRPSQRRNNVRRRFVKDQQ
jgi:hypothetical protein